MGLKNKKQNPVEDEEIIIEAKYGPYEDFSFSVLNQSDNIKNTKKSHQLAKNVSKKNDLRGISKKEYLEIVAFLKQKEKIKKQDQYINIDIKRENEKVSQPLKKSKNTHESKELIWYLKNSIWPALFISLFNFLVVTVEYFIYYNYFENSFLWFSLLKWPYAIFIFLIVSYLIVKKKNQLAKTSGFLCAFSGFQSGIMIFVIKLLFYREIFSIMYFLNELIFLTLIGFTIGIISGVLFSEEKKYES